MTSKYTTREARLARCTFLWPGLTPDQRQEILDPIYRGYQNLISNRSTLIHPGDFWPRLTAAETKLVLQKVESLALKNRLNKKVKEPSPGQRAAIAKINAMMGRTL